MKKRTIIPDDFWFRVGITKKSKILAQEKSEKSKTLACFELGPLWSKSSMVTSTSYCRRPQHTNLGLYTHLIILSLGGPHNSSGIAKSS